MLYMYYNHILIFNSLLSGNKESDTWLEIIVLQFIYEEIELLISEFIKPKKLVYSVRCY